jgi:hypothetical protein
LPLAAGTSVSQSATLTAPATPGTYYVWVVADRYSQVTNQSNVNNDLQHSAAFTVQTPATYTLSIAGTGTGSGRITGGTASSPGDFNCAVNGSAFSGACSKNYPAGKAITLTATANSGSSFTGWSGCNSASGTTCNIIMPGADKQVTPAFNNFTLSASAYCNTALPPTAPAIKLSWTLQNGATSYDLYRNGILYSQGISQTSFDNNANVAAGGAYGYFVVARRPAGNVASNPVSVWVPSNVCSQAMLPDLIVPAQSFQVSPRTVAAGSNAIVSFTIHNRGGGSASPSIAHVRLSKSASIVTVNDPLLLNLATPGLAQQGDHTRGDSINVSEQITIPNNQAAGQYNLWIIFYITSSAGQGRTNEANDKIAIPITVTNPQGPDLVARNLNLSQQKIAPGGTTTFSFSIANQGSQLANPSTAKIYLSASNVDINPSDPSLGNPINVPRITAGGVLQQNVTVNVPAGQPVGSYYLWVKLDTNNTAG